MEKNQVKTERRNKIRRRIRATVIELQNDQDLQSIKVTSLHIYS